MAQKQQVKVDNRTLMLSNANKVLYPGDGFTKGQVIDYYTRIAEWILPHLKNRPVTLKRFPDGVSGQAFYEKNASRFTPDWVATASIPRRGGGAPIRYILINDRATLVWCANLASLELHSFLHRVPPRLLASATAPDKPDAMVFDLDPGEGTDLVACAWVAFLLRDALDGMGLKTFAKFSGSKGLQVYAPLNTPVSYGATQPFARAMAERLEREHPELVVSEMAKDLRAGKIFIDWSQNSDFKTTVSAYSLRAKRDQPFVSLPVSWEELEDIVRTNEPERLCLGPEAVLKRLEKVGDLFAPVLTLKQKLPAAPSEPLDTYRKKRNFSKTTEPAPGSIHPEKAGARFVIQKHAASHLHYDFRLEMDGVLKSWAVPKGVPYGLRDKRLAMATEDHPIEYIDFEGTIPRDEYGGGTVMVWDTGSYQVVDGKYGSGKLHFILNGKKLQGEWVLVKGRPAQKNSWFLLKTGEAATPPGVTRENASALTGRTMEQIAGDHDAQGQNNRTRGASG